jgi:hypothetical protein
MSEESSNLGRPKKADHEKRSEVLKCYATKKQAMQIEEKANDWGMDISNYLRAVALQEDIKTKYGQAELKKIKGQLGGIYGCVNQIAKKVNQGEPLEETTATLEVEGPDEKPYSKEMNFGELMIYLHNTVEQL